MTFKSDEHIVAVGLKFDGGVMALSNATIQIDAIDLQRLIEDNEHMRKQVRELQAKSTEQLEENRKLRRETEDSFDVFRAVNELSRMVFEVSCSKGWHDAPVPIPTHVALLCSEASELFEAFRSNTLYAWCDKEIGLTNFAEELADIVIRSMDLAAEYKIDLGNAVRVKHEFNKTRPFRHGNKAA